MILSTSGAKKTTFSDEKLHAQSSFYLGNKNLGASGARARIIKSIHAKGEGSAINRHTSQIWVVIVHACFQDGRRQQLPVRVSTRIRNGSCQEENPMPVPHVYMRMMQSCKLMVQSYTLMLQSYRLMMQSYKL